MEVIIMKFTKYLNSWLQLLGLIYLLDLVWSSASFNPIANIVIATVLVFITFLVDAWKMYSQKKSAGAESSKL